MTPRQAQLQVRQQQLLARSANLRGRLALQSEVLQTPLAWADLARAAWVWMRANPAWPASALVAVVVMRPRRAWRIGLRLWWAWRTFKHLRARLTT